jgi:hypothetical protein
MKAPQHHRVLLHAIGQDVLSGILITKTTYHEWPIGIMWDVYRVLVAVGEIDEHNNLVGVSHVSLDYGELCEEDKTRFYGTLPQVVALIAEQTEDAIEYGNIEENEPRNTTLMELLADDWGRPYDIAGNTIQVSA